MGAEREGREASDRRFRTRTVFSIPTLSLRRETYQARDVPTPKNVEHLSRALFLGI